MGPVVRLKAEGTIRGDWVPLLEGECLRHLGSHRMVELDVTGIGFVDREGAAMVRSLVDKGVRLVGASALFEALLPAHGHLTRCGVHGTRKYND